MSSGGDMLWTTVCGGCGSEGGGRLCARCRAVEEPDPVPGELVEWIGSLAPYDSGLGRAVLRCKGTGDRGLAMVLARHLRSRIVRARGPLVDVTRVTWAPSPWPRRLVRGFNLAACLGHDVGRGLGVPCGPSLSMARGRRQAGASARSRVHNLAGRVRARREQRGVVLIVDDVTTTGATMEACARELLGAGAERVLGLTLCRVVVDAAAG